MTVRVSAATRDAALQAALDRINIGGAGQLRVYSGSQPSGPDAGVGAATLLATFTLNNPAFNAPSGGTAAMNLPTPIVTNAVAAGTASWARILNGSGAAIYDGSINPSTGDFVINFASLVVGQQVKLTAGTLTFPL